MIQPLFNLFKTLFMEIDYSKIVLNETHLPDKFLLSYNSKHAYVGSIIADIILCKKRGLNTLLINEELNNKYENIGIIDVNEIVEKELPNLLIDKKPDKVKKIFTIYKPAYSGLFRFSKLISTKYFYFVFSFLLLTNIFISTLNNKVIAINGLDMVIYSILLFLVLLFHEFGHLIASVKYNVSPKDINFGVYTIIPVFYTDLSEIWKLSPQKRIIINLSGIYVQLILGLISYSLFLMTNEVVFYNLFSTNLLISLINLNPFLRFDGFWVITDFFNEKNLIENSNAFLFSFFHKREKQSYSYVLKIYAVLRVLFIGYIFYFFIQFGVQMYNSSHMLQLNLKMLTISNVFYLIVLLYYLFKLINYTLKKIKLWKHKIF